MRREAKRSPKKTQVANFGYLVRRCSPSGAPDDPVDHLSICRFEQPVYHPGQAISKQYMQDHNRGGDHGDCSHAAPPQRDGSSITAAPLHPNFRLANVRVIPLPALIDYAITTSI
jgi:hypothetical protein